MFHSLIALVASFVVFQASDGWSRGVEGHSRRLDYGATVTILGRSTRLDASFYCTPERTKSSTGALGFILELHDPDGLSGFTFGDFEGPDAPSLKRKLLTATIVRANGTTRTVQASPTGWYSPRGGFAFEVSADFDRKNTPARQVLDELAADARALKLVITDYRVATTRLEVTIPVPGNGDDFRWLLAGLK